jgi:CDP-glycerol glycerophosphotransferase (TagB/SpsB family)
LSLKKKKHYPAESFLAKLIERFYLRQFLFLVYALFFKLLSYGQNTPEPVWLIGENSGECLQDNGYCFYRFCRQHLPHLPIFFILDKQSINIDPFLVSDSNILWYGSPTHAEKFIQAQVCLFSTTHRDIAWKTIFSLFKQNSVKVFLQHGIMGFKKTGWWYNRSHNSMDIFCVSSALEKNIIDRYFDFSEQVPQITGLARYDRLTNRTPRSRQTILYMPTWRDWQVDTIEESLFADTVSSLLNNRSLLTLLGDNDIILKFYPHKNMRRVLDDSRLHFQERSRDRGKKSDPLQNGNSKRIQLIRPGQETVQDLLCTSNLLITDYSSVCWDFFYLAKPVLFYQFDQEEYLLKKGSYLNLNRDSFGEVFQEEKLLIAAMERYIRTNFRELSRYRPLRKKYFAFHDRHNCRRIFDAVTRLITEPASEEPRE